MALLVFLGPGISWAYERLRRVAPDAAFRGRDVQMVRKGKSAAAAFVEWAERVEWVEVVLRDGRVFQGNVVRNPIRQTGSVVNAVTETRHDFPLDDVLSVRKVSDPRLVNLS
jgi:hypothetical protein